jgi:hypothetical protein
MNVIQQALIGNLFVKLLRELGKLLRVRPLDFVEVGVHKPASLP